MKNFQNSPSQIFISYRREGGEVLAQLLYDRLTEKKYRVFLDVESLRSGKFNEALYKKIEECNDFVLVLPENSLKRCVDPDDWLRLEIEHALKCKKNIIPIMMRNFKFPKYLPPLMEDLPNYNGIPASMDFFEAVVEKLINMLTSKPENSWDIKKILAVCVITGLLVGGAWSFANKFISENSAPDTVQEKVINASNSKIERSNAKINGSNNEIYGDNNIITGSNNEIHGDNNEVTGSNNNSYGQNNRSNGSNNNNYL